MKLKLIVMVCAIALVAAACSSDSDEPGESGPITIGISTPLTGSLAQPGDWWALSIEFAVDEINKSGGIDGREVQLVTADDQGDPTQAVSVINRLINQDKVDFVIGPLTSDGLKAAIPTLTDANMGSISAVGSPEFTPDVLNYGFSTLLNAADQARSMVGYAASTGAQSVAILHDTGLQGRSANEALIAAVDEAGLELTGNRQFDVGDTDMTAQLLRLKEGNPDHLLLYPTTGEDVGHALEGMGQLEWDIPVTGGFAANFVGTAKEIAGPNSYKQVTATTYASFGVCPGDEIPAKTEAFISQINDFDADRAESLSLNFGAATRDSVWILKAAIEGAGSTDGDKVAAWLEQNSSTLGADLINTSVDASAESHFLFGTSAIAVVKPDNAVSEGIFEKADC